MDGKTGGTMIVVPLSAGLEGDATSLGFLHHTSHALSQAYLPTAGLTDVSRTGLPGVSFTHPAFCLPSLPWLSFLLLSVPRSENRSKPAFL